MRQPVKSKYFPDSADNFFLNKNCHYTIFGLDVSKTIPNLPANADRPLHCKWAFRKIEVFFLNNIFPHRTVLKAQFHTGDLVTCTGDQGFLPLTWGNWKFWLENQMVCAILFGKCQKI